MIVITMGCQATDISTGRPLFTTIIWRVSRRDDLDETLRRMIVQASKKLTYQAERMNQHSSPVEIDHVGVISLTIR